MHGERVKELVCDGHGEAVVVAGHLVEGVVPCEWDATFLGSVEDGAFEGAHGQACLDEVGSDDGKLMDDLGTDGEWAPCREGRERTRRMSSMALQMHI